VAALVADVTAQVEENERSHVRLAVMAEAAAGGSSSVRPIAYGDAITRLTERSIAVQEKERMARALMPLQTGVGVAGGMSMGVQAIQAMLELDPNKRGLNIDIMNMFNALCRVSMLEDLLDSETLLGEDFSDLAPYVAMCYLGDYKLWFKVAETDEDGQPTGRMVWEAVSSERGVKQGGPLSVFLASMTLIEVMRAAQRALDNFNGVCRDPGAHVSVAERKAAYELAERLGSVIGFLDDATIVARVEGLVKAFAAYKAKALERGWMAVEKKTVLTGNYFGDRPPVAMHAAAPHGGPAGATEGSGGGAGGGESTVAGAGSLPEGAAAGAGEGRGADRGAGEASAGAGDDGAGVDNTAGRTENKESEIGGCEPPLQDSRSSPSVGKFDLSDGVGTAHAGTVLHAHDSLINLGIPLGTDAFVCAALEDYVATHDRRLRTIARFAAESGPAVTHKGNVLSVQLALAFLRFSANARDVHLLRAVGRRLVDTAAGMHDRGVRAATAIVLGQCDLPTTGRLCDIPDSAMTKEYVRAYPAISLSVYAGGLGLRAWHSYADCAHVGQWAQAFQSSLYELADGTHDTYYPALRTVIAAADCLRELPDGAPRKPEHLRAAYDLAQSWRRCCEQTAAAYPDETDWVGISHPAHWLLATEGSVACIEAVPVRGQKILSRSVTKLRTAEVRAAMAVDEGAGALAFHRNHLAECSAECGALYLAQPWMDDGHMHLGRTALLSLVARRYRLQPPPDIVPAGRCPCGKRIPHTARGITEMDRLDHVECTCSKRGGLRTSVHDELTKLIVVFLKAAGYIDVKLEDRTWDVGPRVAQARQDLGRNLHQHRRPDIVCRHPYSGRVYVLDTTIAWRGMANAGLAYAEPGWAAAKAEARKNAAYAAALERQAERFGNGERFVPLAFEISGTWGVGMRELFAEGCKLAGRQRSADLFHWSAMEFMGHWRQRLSVALGRGRARCLEAAAVVAATWDVDPASEHSRFGF